MPEPPPAGLTRARRGLFELYRSRRDTVWIEAVGGSMRPTLHAGDWLLVEFSERRPALGEIAVFPLGGEVVVHRVVRRGRGAAPIVTKGDARLECDPPVPAGDVLGVVRAVRRGAAGPVTGSSCTGLRALAAAGISTGVAAGVAAARHLPAPARRGLGRIAAAPTRAALRLAAGGHPATR